MSQLPIWMQYLTAISTPIIALMVAMIAFAQWRTARQRMILDLFQRRMDLIDLVSRAASTILIEGALRNENVDGFLRATRGDKFLFGSKVTTYLSETYNKERNKNSSVRNIWPSAMNFFVSTRRSTLWLRRTFG
jgi:hypothetical protein